MSVRLVAASHPYGTPSPLSPLIGRREEIAAALALLADPEVRLLTMIGPGGIGKTRLALRVAADSSDDFAGRRAVCFARRDSRPRTCDPGDRARRRSPRINRRSRVD